MRVALDRELLVRTCVDYRASICMLSNLTCRGFMGPCEKHGLLFFSFFLVKSEEHGFELLLHDGE